MRYTVIPRAVVLIGRYVMLVRAAPGLRPPSPGRWHLPGGEIRSGESPQRAVARIVAQRSGLHVEVGGCLDALTRRGPDPETGRQAPLLHLYFLCTPRPDAGPGLLPGTGGPELDMGLVSGSDEHTSGIAGKPGERGNPPRGADWGWTDLASGLAALKHDVVGPEVIRYVETLTAVRQPPPAVDGPESTHSRGSGHGTRA